MRFGERTGRTAIELRWVIRYFTNPVTAPLPMSIIIFIQWWPVLLYQSYRLIAPDPSPVLKPPESVRLRAAGARTLLFFGNQVDLVRYEEVRVVVCTDIFGPFLCVQEARA